MAIFNSYVTNYQRVIWCTHTAVSRKNMEELWQLGIEQAVLRSFKYNSPFEEVLPTATG